MSFLVSFKRLQMDLSSHNLKWKLNHIPLKHYVDGSGEGRGEKKKIIALEA